MTKRAEFDPEKAKKDAKEMTQWSAKDSMEIGSEFGDIGYSPSKQVDKATEKYSSKPGSKDKKQTTNQE